MSKEKCVLSSTKRANKSHPALRGLSNIEQLLALVEGETPELFPFCRELASYLLLVVSLWPNNQHRLLDAARIFSGALNYHMIHTSKDRTFRDGDAVSGYEDVAFECVFPAIKLVSFNSIFFERIGGLESLLFCPSIEQLRCDIRDRTKELKIVHDTIEFLIKAAKILPPKLRSASFAYEAISCNVFSREEGYGINSGPKRTHDVSNKVTTAGSVREKWKRASDTVILSYVLTELYRFPHYDLTYAQPFVLFSLNARRITKLRLLLSVIARQLVEAKATQNESIAKWTAALNVSLPDKPFVLFRLTEEELERVFEIDRKLHRKALSSDEQIIAREKRRTWWRLGRSGQVTGL